MPVTPRKDRERLHQVGGRPLAVPPERALVEATQRTYELTDARYRAGIDSSLSLLDAQRELYTAQRSLIVTQLARETNLVTLYKVLGGGWRRGP
jgi:multidrug efflux system outer membrane protein